MIPTYPHLPTLPACLAATERILRTPNRGVAAVVAALFLTEPTNEERIHDATALLVSLAAHPIPDHVEGRTKVALTLVALIVGHGAKGSALTAPLIRSFVLRDEDDADPLLDWLTEAPPIPAKTLRRRAKLAARAHTSGVSR